MFRAFANNELTKLVILPAILLLAISSARVVGAETKIRVLFIGNSLTFANDLPGLIAQLAQARRHIMEYDMSAPGGYRFSQHASDPNTLKKINAGNWDFVVLQEQSQLPAFSEEQVKRDVYPFAARLCHMIRKANPHVKIVFYETMAKKNGDPQNLALSPELATYAGMQKRLNYSYGVMARANKALLAPVGLAWADSRREHPSLELYADETHPNQTGTYLAACVFYSVFFRESPAGLPAPASLDEETALTLQKTAGTYSNIF
jgi:hypothetical protein